MLPSKLRFWEAADGGTGFFINPHHFITNFHVVHSFKRGARIVLLMIQNKNGKVIKQRREARILKLSSVDDLALLKVDKPITDYLPIQEPPFYLNKGEISHLMGYRAGGEFETLSRVMRGRMSDEFETIAVKYQHFYPGENVIEFADSSSPIGEGFSGGPVLRNSKVIGVVHGVPLGNPYTLYAIPAKTLHRFLMNQGKDCGQLSGRECIDREWEILRKKFLEGDSVARYRANVYIYIRPF